VLVSSRRFHHILKAAAGLFFVANPAAALAVTSPPVMSPAPGSTPTPSNMPMSAHDMSGMTFNTNGVMSMYGMSRAGMSIDASGMDPSMMPSTTDVGTPMTREGSGTSWMPDATTLYGRMWRRGDDMTMTHGALWLRYADVGSLRGEQKLSLPSWWMFMRTHPTSPAAQAGFRAMFSGDFLGVGGSGYPLVFQTGEEWNDRPLHDVQHPHDLVSELSFTYSGQLGKRRSAYLYVGYPGEPALGPPSFMHRPIAYDYAPAPIGHHWEDATHITFGVVTAGITSTKFKAEGSAFTGREPNQTRTNFDPIRLDSYSERLSWNPNPSIAAHRFFTRVRLPLMHPGHTHWYSARITRMTANVRTRISSNRTSGETGTHSSVAQKSFKKRETISLFLPLTRIAFFSSAPTRWAWRTIYRTRPVRPSVRMSRSTQSPHRSCPLMVPEARSRSRYFFGFAPSPS
jgi:hypothetical protein